MRAQSSGHRIFTQFQFKAETNVFCDLPYVYLCKTGDEPVSYRLCEEHWNLFCKAAPAEPGLRNRRFSGTVRLI